MNRVTGSLNLGSIFFVEIGGRDDSCGHWDLENVVFADDFDSVFNRRRYMRLVFGNPDANRDSSNHAWSNYTVLGLLDNNSAVCNRLDGDTMGHRVFVFKRQQDLVKASGAQSSKGY